MNFLKGYMDSVTNFVNNITDTGDPEKTPQTASTECAEQPRGEENVDSQQSENKESGFLDWFSHVARPSTDSAMYYLNNLASMGSNSDAPSDLPSKPTDEVITQDVSCVPVVSPTGEVDILDPVVDSNDPLLHWIDGISSRTEGIWKQMKHDFSEVVECVSKDSKTMVNRTAESVRHHMSVAAAAARKLDPDQFILPNRTDDATESEPIDSLDRAELPNMENLRSDVSFLVDGFISTLFGKSNSHGPATTNRREARLQILRADPGTYEHEPIDQGPLRYGEWREAYFNEDTCQPRPGIPLCGARDISNDGVDANQLIQPVQDSPDDLLTAYPFMRTYLTQLVRVEGQSDQTGITDGDFWSRYYYRVWLLDVDERRRQRLTERVSGSATVNSTAASTKSNMDNEPDEHAAVLSDANDWADTSEGDDPLDTPQCTKPLSVNSSTPKASSDHTNVQSPLEDSETKKSAIATASKPRTARGNRKKSRRSKRSEGDESVGPHSLSRDSSHVETSIEPFEKPALSATKLPPGKTKPDDTFEELVSSGSSSVVVLSVSDDDRVCDPVLIDLITPESESSLTPTIPALQSSTLSQPDDWEEWS